MTVEVNVCTVSYCKDNGAIVKGEEGDLVETADCLNSAATEIFTTSQHL